jgi:polyhydroxyalkanoate synthesis regulator phasin
MSDILRLNRVQIANFVGDDPDAVRTIERLIEKVNTLESEVAELQTQVTDLETRVTALETP